jgi:hypothetical protein
MKEKKFLVFHNNKFKIKGNMNCSLLAQGRRKRRKTNVVKKTMFLSGMDGANSSINALVFAQQESS